MRVTSLQVASTRLRPACARRFDNGGRDAVRGEDHGSLGHLLERLHAIGLGHQRDARLLELAGHVLVVHQVAEHGDRLAAGAGSAFPFCDSYRFHDAMAVATRRDPDDVHRLQSTRGFPLDGRTGTPVAVAGFDPRAGATSRGARRPLAPTASFTPSGSELGDTNASSVPAMISRLAAPSASSTARTATRASASPRRSWPGRRMASPSISPVPPLITITLSSSIAVGHDQRPELEVVATEADRSGNGPEHPAVGEQHERCGDAEQHAAREADECDADVVLDDDEPPRTGASCTPVPI